MKCLLSLIRYTSNTLKAKVRLKDFAETNVGDQLPMLATKRWRTRVKALVQTKRRRKRSLCSHVTLGRHMCCCPSRWLFPSSSSPTTLFVQSSLSSRCYQRTAVSSQEWRPTSCLGCTGPPCTLVNMSEVGRAPWTHMSHFLDISHCALDSLPLCSFMAFLWGHFSATIRDVTDSCSKGRSHRDPPDIIDPENVALWKGGCIVHHSAPGCVGLSPVEKAGAECTWGAAAVRGGGTLAPWCIDRVQTERRARQLPQPWCSSTPPPATAPTPT